jgi:hypothetical protein
MRMTVEIPDDIFRQAKSKAAAEGISLRQFVTEAIVDKLKAASAAEQKPWMKHIGKLKDLHQENERVNELIEEAFEVIDNG